MKDFIIAWTPADRIGREFKPKTAGKVLVAPHPDTMRITDDYELTVGACYMVWHEMTIEEQERALISEAFRVLCDGIDVDDLLQEFAKIDRWRDMKIFLTSGYCERAFLKGNPRGDWKLNPYNP